MYNCFVEVFYGCEANGWVRRLRVRLLKIQALTSCGCRAIWVTFITGVGVQGVLRGEADEKEKVG